MHSFRDDIPVPFTVSATRSSKISELLVLKELIDMPLGSLCKLIIARARTHKTHTELLPCSIYGSNHENASLVKFFFCDSKPNSKMRWPRESESNFMQIGDQFKTSALRKCQLINNAFWLYVLFCCFFHVGKEHLFVMDKFLNNYIVWIRFKCPNLYIRPWLFA